MKPTTYINWDGLKDIPFFYCDTKAVSYTHLVRRKKIKEVEEDAGLYKEFLLWANSPESVEKKKQI